MSNRHENLQPTTPIPDDIAARVNNLLEQTTRAIPVTPLEDKKMLKLKRIKLLLAVGAISVTGVGLYGLDSRYEIESDAVIAERPTGTVFSTGNTVHGNTEIPTSGGLANLIVPTPAYTRSPGGIAVPSGTPEPTATPERQRVDLVKQEENEKTMKDFLEEQGADLNKMHEISKANNDLYQEYKDALEINSTSATKVIVPVQPSLSNTLRKIYNDNFGLSIADTRADAVKSLVKGNKFKQVKIPADMFESEQELADAMRKGTIVIVDKESGKDYEAWVVWGPSSNNGNHVLMGGLEMENGKMVYAVDKITGRNTYSLLVPVIEEPAPTSTTATAPAATRKPATAVTTGIWKPSPTIDIKPSKTPTPRLTITSSPTSTPWWGRYWPWPKPTKTPKK